MKNLNNFEDVLKQKLDGYQASAPSWDSFEKALDASKSPKSSVFNGRNLLGGISILAVVGVAAYYMNINEAETLPVDKNHTAYVDENSSTELSLVSNDDITNTQEDDNSSTISELNSLPNSHVAPHEQVNIKSANNVKVEEGKEVLVKGKNIDSSGDNAKLAEMEEIESVEVSQMQDFKVLLSESKACVGSDIRIQVDKINMNTDYIVDFGDGNRAEGFSAIHSYKEPGVYNVKMIAKGERGEDIVKENSIKIIESPEIAPIKAEVVKDNIVNKTIFSAKSSVDNYEWYINGKLVSDEADFDYTFEQKGKYNILCKSSNSFCSSNVGKEIDVQGYYNLEYYTPTAFKPDGDGKNDFFEFTALKSLNISNVSIKIFDRHGKLYFESDNVNGRWDGRSQQDGKLAPSNSGYFWIVELTNEMNLTEVYKGTFVLIR